MTDATKPILNESDRTDDRARLLTADEVAYELNVSRSFAYQLMQKGSIRVVKLGRAVRVRRQDLEAFVEANLSHGPQLLGGIQWGA
jgi:excisionase family DNA binding protein